MKQATLFLVLLSLAVLGHSQMSFNLGAATYQVTSGGYYSLSVPVTGGISPYSYLYQAYPATWIQVGNNINIPLIQTNPGGTWAIKVIVTDALNNKLQRSLVVKISNGGDPLIGDYPYDQTFTFSSTGAVTSIPTNSAIVSSSSSSSSSYSSSSSSSSSSNPGVGFTTSTAGVIPLQASGIGSNTNLPTSGQLDNLINSGDIVAIKQIVQSVITSSLTCVGKTQYLSDFLGRISTFIVIKSSQVSQLQGIYNTTQNQIQTLRAQIANYTSSITNLGIPSLQGQLNDILNNLQLAYNAYNNGNIDLTPFNLNITANIQSIANLTNQKTEVTGQLASDKRSLNDTLTLITSLQQQLAAAQNNRDLLSARILVETTNITSITQQIDYLNADNVKLNNQINLINSNKTTLQASYQSL